MCINCELNSYQNGLPQFVVKQTAHVSCSKKCNHLADKADYPEVLLKMSACLQRSK